MTERLGILEYLERRKRDMVAMRDHFNAVIEAVDFWIGDLTKSEAWDRIEEMQSQTTTGATPEPIPLAVEHKAGKWQPVKPQKSVASGWRSVIEEALSKGPMGASSIASAIHADRAKKTVLYAALSYGLKRGWLRRDKNGLYRLAK